MTRPINRTGIEGERFPHRETSGRVSVDMAKKAIAEMNKMMSKDPFPRGADYLTVRDWVERGNPPRRRSLWESFVRFCSWPVDFVEGPIEPVIKQGWGVNILAFCIGRIGVGFILLNPPTRSKP